MHLARSRAVLGYLFILPSFVFLVLFTYYPVLRSFWMSLYRSVPLTTDTEFVAFAHYARMFQSDLFWQVIRNNLIYSVASVALAATFGLLLAVLINRPLRAGGLFRFALFYPTIIPLVAAAMVWVFLFNPGFGAVNQGLRLLGIRSDIDWLGTAPYALASIIVVAVWKYTGFYMLLFLAGLQSINENLYEAARIEGANPWHQFWYITLPLLSPTTFFVMLIAVVHSFRAVDQVYVMTDGGPANSTNVLLYYIYQNGFLYWNLGYASAASVFLFIILLLGTLAYFHVLGRRVHYAS